MDYGFEPVTSHDGTSAHFRAFFHSAGDVPPHWHNHLELVFVLCGEARITVDGAPCSLAERDLVIIDAGAIHNSVRMSDETALCGVHLDLDFFEAQGLPGFSQRRYQCRSWIHAKHFDEQVVEPMRALIGRMILSRGHPSERLLQQCLAGLLALHIYNTVQWEPREEGKDPKRSGGRERVMRIMHALRAENATLSLEDFASSEGMTVSHLSRLFKHRVGIGFRDYVQSLRLDRAAQTLRSTRQAIADVATDSGFQNGSLFYAKFKERFGCGPREYRNRAIGVDAGDTEDTLKALRDSLTSIAENMDLYLGPIVGVPTQGGGVRIAAPHGDGLKGR